MWEFAEQIFSSIKQKITKIKKVDENTAIFSTKGTNVEIITKPTFETEKDIESRRKQMNKGERVSQSVLDNWNKEQEKRKNKYGSK